MTVRIFIASICASLIYVNAVFATDGAPANSELVVDQTFDSGALDSKWHVNSGKWLQIDGVLRASELPSEKHAAAARFPVATENAVYQLRFRLINDGQGFHFGFDPAPGELDKKGHLFSVIVTPDSWKILKHADKKRPNEDASEVLAQRKMTFDKGRWYKLRLTTWGPYVTATIDGDTTLKTSHRTFAVKKPTLVLRCLGSGVEVDDIKVWRQLK